eukprot:9481242-Pyramimonas_sp.AAC.1
MGSPAGYSYQTREAPSPIPSHLARAKSRGAGLFCSRQSGVGYQARRLQTSPMHARGLCWSPVGHVAAEGVAWNYYFVVYVNLKRTKSSSKISDGKD